jgi:hypothetical protein
MIDVCPTCGQPILMRHGVRLSPTKAAIFDMIERRQDGIALSSLAETLYPGVDHHLAVGRIKTQIWQINSLFESTDSRVCAYRIVNNDWRYRLVEVAL